MKILIKTFVIFLLSFFMFCCTGCKKDISPIDNKEEPVCQLPTDTTSHEFTWTVDTIGEYGSELNDIAIISENEVWAGGEINRKNKRPHTLMIWDGSKWKSSIPPLTTIYPDTSRAPINAIFSLDENNIYLMNDNGEFGYWDGQEWYSEYVQNKDGHIYSIWGDARDNIYLAGGNGAVTRYDGKNFIKQSTPTNVDLTHITGFTDPKSGKTKLWAAGMTTLLHSEDGQNWQIVWDEDNPFLPDNYLNPTAINIIDNCLLLTAYYYTNTRLYLMNPYDINDYKLLAEFKSYVYDIGGNSINDLFFSGSYTRIHHYNGKTIKHYADFLSTGILSAVDINNNQVVIAGFIGSPISKGIILHGIRN